MGPIVVTGDSRSGSDDPIKIIFTHPKIVDSEVGNLILDPVEGGVVSRTVLLLHEVAKVGHPRQLVQMGRGEVLWLQHQGDPELPLCYLHGSLHVVRSIARIQSLPMRHQSWSAVVQQSGQVDAIVPVRCEVLNIAVRQHRLQRQIILLKR